MSRLSTVILKIEFQRVQSFLFKVPRLSDMEGANALLGHLVRKQLPLALWPYLAAENESAQLKDLRLYEKTLNPAHDPLLKTNTTGSSDTENNSGLDYQDQPSSHIAQGLLVRDGGRVWARIEQSSLQAAMLAAAECIQLNCPGLGYIFNTDPELPDLGSSATDLVGLPCFHWADDGGEAPASELIKIGDDQRALSRASILKREARSGSHLWNISTCLQILNKIPVHKKTEGLDFHDIAQGHYLAVIHLDGNSIGQRSREWMEKLKKKSEYTDSSLQYAMERFFLGMRSATRQAIIKGLNSQFEHCPQNYRLLMLGGDDVLLVCRADKALPLVTDIAEKLTTIDLADEKPLTIAAGIVIAKPNLPFHRLHQLAEELASSAKRIAIDPKSVRRSTVDWLVSTSSWINTIDEHRASWEKIAYSVPEQPLKTQTLLLTSKPYPILRDSKNPAEPSLQALLELAEKISKHFNYGTFDAPDEETQHSGVRSQLRWFLAELRKGKHYSRAMWPSLPAAFRQALTETAPSSLPVPDEHGEGLWLKLSDGIDRCWLPDLVELLELSVIGSAAYREHAREDEAHVTTEVVK